MKIRRDFSEGFAAVYFLVIALAVSAVGAGAYYYLKDSGFVESDQKANSAPLKTLTWHEAKMEDLEEAKLKVKTETDKLNFLVERSRSEESIITDLTGQYASIEAKIVAKTNPLFNSLASNPQLLIPTSSASAINAKKLQIDAALANWKKTLEAIALAKKQVNSTVVVANLITTAIADMALVQSYVHDLQTIVSTLTPETSGLTQSQIDAYAAAALAAAAQSAASAAATAALQNQTGSGSTGSSGQSSGTTGNSDSNPPIVTPTQIEHQQDAVTEAKVEEKAAEDAVTESENTPPGGSGDTGDSADVQEESNNSGVLPITEHGEPDPPKRDIELIEGTNSL